MKTGILGTGVVGQTLAEKLVSLGHEVFMGTRNIEKSLAKTEPDGFGRPPLKEWHSKNPAVKITTLTDAASKGEIIINATNGAGTIEALKIAGERNLAGKVLLDISNPLDFSKGMPPTLFLCNTDSLGELIQREFPNAKVVKSLNTMNAYIMVNPNLISGDHSVFLSGNDANAKQTVRQLLSEFGWKDKNMLDLGDITTARGTEQLLPIWARIWMATQKPSFNFNVVFG